MPYALSIGIDEKTFWTLNPHKIKPYKKAYKLKMEERDAEMWRMGIYVQSAVAVAVEHNLAGRKAKSKYIEQPILSDAEKNEKKISRNKRKEQTEMLFTKLNIMKANFEITQKQKK